MNFDLNNITLTTLVGYFENDQGQNARHIQIPINVEVQNELKNMLAATSQKIGLPANTQNLPTFSPAEKYSSEEPLKLPLTTEYVTDLVATLSIQNLPSDVNALNFISELEYYYAIFTDGQNRKLFAFRRAAQFKGIIKSKLTIIHGGILSVLDRPVFKLDNDFDYIVDNQDIFILRPSGFEFTTNVHGAVIQSAAANATTIATSITFLDISRISSYASTHARSARLLAAIRSRNDLHLIDRNLLLTACQQFGISISHNQNGMVGPNSGHEYDFLCIIDRRAYTATLIPNQPEKYEAASRTLK
jgi:hypothetical protein